MLSFQAPSMILSISNIGVQELICTMNNYNSGTGFLNDIDQNINEDVITKIKCAILIIHSTNGTSVSLEHAKYSKIEIFQNEWRHLFWIGKDSVESIRKTIEFIEQ